MREIQLSRHFSKLCFCPNVNRLSFFFFLSKVVFRADLKSGMDHRAGAGGLNEAGGFVKWDFNKRKYIFVSKNEFNQKVATAKH